MGKKPIWTPPGARLDYEPVTDDVCHLLLQGFDAPPGLSGFLSKMLGQDRTPFTMFLLTASTNRVAMARLLALALIDRAFPVIHPSQFPMRHGFATLRDDGLFRHRVTKTFAPWITLEVSRLSKRLLPEAAAILEELTSARHERLRRPSKSPFHGRQEDLFEIDLPKVAVDLTGVRQSWEGLPRHRVVRLEYERDRYMAHLERQELDRRAQQIFNGFYQIDGEGRITLDKGPITHSYMDLMTEVMHEYGLRGIPDTEYAPLLAEDQALARGRGEVFRTAGATAAAYAVPESPYLVKYGKLKRLQDCLHSGRVRVPPAASFNDSSLNPAQRDQELLREVDWDLSILPYAEPGQTPSFAGVPRTGRLRTEASVPTNYYVYCLAAQLRARLFNDFRADAALVIREPDIFFERFSGALQIELPGWRAEARAVEYFDPLNVSPSEVQIPFWKHFSYAYQEEVRLVAFPPHPEEELPVLFPKLGDLSDIADIVVLERPEPRRRRSGSALK